MTSDPPQAGFEEDEHAHHTCNLRMEDENENERSERRRCVPIGCFTTTLRMPGNAEGTTSADRDVRGEMETMVRVLTAIRSDGLLSYNRTPC